MPPRRILQLSDIIEFAIEMVFLIDFSRWTASLPQFETARVKCALSHTHTALRRHTITKKTNGLESAFDDLDVSIVDPKQVLCFVQTHAL